MRVGVAASAIAHFTRALELDAKSGVKALIQQSGEEVASGTRLVAKAEDRLTAILAAVRENSGLMAAISEAAHGQAAAIGEVNTAVRSMDEMTQHNAALVEQNNAAIQRAEAQAGDLDEIVAAFRLDAEEPSEEALDEKIAAVEASARGLGPAIRRRRRWHEALRRLTPGSDGPQRRIASPQ